MPRVFQRVSARRDLVEHYLYLAENAGLEIADRFLVCAEESFTDLARQPNMGSPVPLRAPTLAGMRKWQVRDFKKYLIFYQPHPDGVSVVRVLHSAQDWWALLGLEAS